MSLGVSWLDTYSTASQRRTSSRRSGKRWVVEQIQQRRAPRRGKQKSPITKIAPRSRNRLAIADARWQTPPRRRTSADPPCASFEARAPGSFGQHGGGCPIPASSRRRHSRSLPAGRTVDILEQIRNLRNPKSSDWMALLRAYFSVLARAVPRSGVPQRLVDDGVGLAISRQHARPSLPSEDADAATTFRGCIGFDSADQRQPVMHVSPCTGRDHANPAGLRLLQARRCGCDDGRSVPRDPKQRTPFKDIAFDHREIRQAGFDDGLPEKRGRKRPDRTH